MNGGKQKESEQGNQIADITCFSFSGHSYYGAVRCETYTVKGIVDEQEFWYMAGINPNEKLEGINRITGANGIYRGPIREGIEAIIEQRKNQASAEATRSNCI